MTAGVLPSIISPITLDPEWRRSTPAAPDLPLVGLPCVFRLAGCCAHLLWWNLQLFIACTSAEISPVCKVFNWSADTSMAVQVSMAIFNIKSAVLNNLSLTFESENPQTILSRNKSSSREPYSHCLIRSRRPVRYDVKHSSALPWDLELTRYWEIITFFLGAQNCSNLASNMAILSSFPAASVQEAYTRWAAGPATCKKAPHCMVSSLADSSDAVL